MADVEGEGGAWIHGNLKGRPTTPETAARHPPMICRVIIATAALLGINLITRANPAVDVVRLPSTVMQPVAALDPESGAVHMVWLRGDPAHGNIYLQTWPGGRPGVDAPIRVNDQDGAAIALGTVRGVQACVGRHGRVHAVWNGSRATAPGAQGSPLLYSRRNDAGTGFEPARNLLGETFLLDGGASVTADGSGRVFVVWHAATRREGATEKDRQVFVVQSDDDGKTFGPPRSLTPAGGVCGCCGLRGITDGTGRPNVLYRAAAVSPGRPMILLDQATPSTAALPVLSDPWPIEACPMSTASLVRAPTPGGRIWGAWETGGRIRLEIISAGRPILPEPVTVSPESGARHPALAVNRNGDVLCAWAEGTGWQRGGRVVWRVLTAEGTLSGEIGHGEGLGVWSFPAVLPRADGSFAVAY
ncbi:MAG: exo-alpha-sialidase [Verrucomicrobiales bacterium]|nr:exo-alpha-sialidase [Verrucomicrobiales bacterium]